MFVTDTGDELSEADADNNRIEKFTNDGRFITTIGSYGLGDGQLNGPYGVAVDRSGNVFVAEGFNNRIQEFAPCPEGDTSCQTESTTNVLRQAGRTG